MLVSACGDITRRPSTRPCNVRSACAASGPNRASSRQADGARSYARRESMPRINSEKNSPCRSGSSTPTVSVRRVIRLRAACVRHVAQLAGGFEDALARGFGDALVTIERARNRGDRDAGDASDIFDRYCHGVPRSKARPGARNVGVNVYVNVYIVRFSLSIVMLRYSRTKPEARQELPRRLPPGIEML